MNSKYASSSGPKAEKSSSKIPKVKHASDIVKSFQVPELKYDKDSPSNWNEFVKALSLVAGIEYGDLFTHVMNGKYPDLDMPSLTSYAVEKKKDLAEINAKYADTDPLKAQAVADHNATWNLGPDEIKLKDFMYIEEYRASLKRVDDYKTKLASNKPKLYFLIKASCSLGSLERVRAKLLSEYEVMEFEMDPLKLFNALRETHTAYGQSGIPADAARARNRYATLKQGEKESLSQFKERMDTLLRAMDSLGIALPSEADQTADLLTKVNAAYLPAATKIDDAFRITGVYPKTPFEAFRLLSELTAEKAFTGSTNTTFNTLQGSTGNKRAQKGQFNAKRDQKPPDNPDEAPKKTEKEGNSSNANDGKKQKKRGSRSKASNNSSRPSRETVRNKYALATTAQDEDVDEDDEYEQGYYGFALTFTTESRHDLKELILLDNQAQNSIFCREDLLSNIRDRDSPSYYKGVGSGAVKATQMGDFLDSITVDYSSDSATNI